MTQAKARFTSFNEYLSYSDEAVLEGRYELIEGELVKLPPESGINVRIANRLLAALLQAAIPIDLICVGQCEVEVPVLQPKDAANRYPDLVVLREDHLPLTERRLTITRDMPPPQLVVEVVSPGRTSRHRDYIAKRAQYAAIDTPEYWLIDPKAQTVTVLELQGDEYREVGVFGSGDRILCPTFRTLNITIERILPGK
jgi:Uma2 family endonuclease